MPATFHAQCRPGSNSVTTNGTPNPNDVRTTPVAPSDSSVCGESSRAPLTVGPHCGHASRSTRTFHAADDGAAISRSTASITAMSYPGRQRPNRSAAEFLGPAWIKERDDRRLIGTGCREIRFTADLQEGRHPGPGANVDWARRRSPLRLDAGGQLEGEASQEQPPGRAGAMQPWWESPRRRSAGGRDRRSDYRAGDGSPSGRRDPRQVRPGVHRRDFHRARSVAWSETTPDSVDRAYCLTWPDVDSRMSSPSSESDVRQVSRMSAYSVGLPKKKLSWFSRALAWPSRL